MLLSSKYTFQVAYRFSLKESYFVAKAGTGIPCSRSDVIFTLGEFPEK